MTAPTVSTWNIYLHQTTPPFPPPPSLPPFLPRFYPPSHPLAWPTTSVHHRARNTWPTWTTQTCIATGQSQTHTVSTVHRLLQKHVILSFQFLSSGAHRRICKCENVSGLMDWESDWHRCSRTDTTIGIGSRISIVALKACTRSYEILPGNFLLWVTRWRSSVRRVVGSL